MISGKSLVAHFTFERFFTGMGSFMILKHMFVPEGAIANFARKDFVPPVLAVAVAGE